MRMGADLNRRKAGPRALAEPIGQKKGRAPYVGVKSWKGRRWIGATARRRAALPARRRGPIMPRARKRREEAGIER